MNHADQPAVPNVAPPPIPPVSPAATTPGIAITSLVLGILSLLCCVAFTGIPAVICGHVAQRRIRNSGRTLTGEGLALAGLIMGYLGIGLTLLVLPIAIPSFLAARETSQFNACMNNLRHIESAKEQAALESHALEGDTIPAAKVEAHVKMRPVCPKGGTYQYNPLGTDASCSVHGTIAEPRGKPKALASGG